MTPVYNRQYGLQSDSLGFLVSQNRLERATHEMGQDIKKMVDILQQMRTDREDNPPAHQLSGLALAVAQASQRQTIDIAEVLTRVEQALVRPTVDVDSLIQNIPPMPQPTVDISTHEDLIRLIRSQTPTPTVDPAGVPSPTPTSPPTPDTPTPTSDDSPTPDATPDDATPQPDGSTPTPDATPASNDVNPPSDTSTPQPDSGTPTPDNATPTPTPTPDGGTPTPPRQRGSDGRFGSKEQSWFDRFKTAITGGVKDGMEAPKGVDPTIDALSELGTLFSPVTKAAGFMLKPIGTMWRNRKKKEPLSDDENRHNRRQIKLLDAIAKALGRGAGRGGAGGGAAGAGGLFGGLFGGLGKFAKLGLKGLAKRLPLIGTLFTLFEAGSDLFNAKTTEQKGAAVGMGTGAVVGGVLGSVLGPVGTIVGSMVGAWVGEKLGGIVAPYFADLVDGMGKSWNESIAPFFTGLNEFVKEKTGIDVGGAVSDAWDATKKFMGFGGDAGSGTASAAKTDYSKSPKGKLSPEKAAKIKEVAQRIGVDPNDLASIISFESAGTFNPSIKNPKSSATGLIQFMGKGATEKGKFNDGTYYGMTRDQFGALSFDEQMVYVEKYYKERGFDGKKQRSLADAYTAVSGYGYKAGTAAYDLNSKWDTNGNKVIEKGEAVLAPEFQAHVKKWIPDAAVPAPAKTTEKPTPVMQSNPDAKAGASGGVLGDAAKAMQATGAMMVIPPLPTVINQARVATVSAIPPAPQVKAPMRLPPPPVPKPAPERMGSKSNQQQPQITSMGDGIGQNVSDRDIAHAVTGGIGMRKWNG